MEVFQYIFVVAIIALVLYAIIKAAIDGERRRRFRKKNRENQYSGSAIKAKKGFWASLFSGTFKNRAEALGEFGERTVSSYLEDLPCEDYLVFNDLLIKDGNHTTQIDHIVISRYGVFVLETKNIHGKVYGSGNKEFWSQYLPDWGYKRYGSTQEHEVRNPLWQNAGHIKSVRKLVFGSDVPVYGIVIFPSETEVHVTAELPVLKMWEVVPYIKQYQDIVLLYEQMDSFKRRLLEVSSRSESDRKHHLENISRNKDRRNAAIASGRCPLCGGQLVLRNGKYGQFWGCSNYPDCKYTLQK